MKGQKVVKGIYKGCKYGLNPTIYHVIFPWPCLRAIFCCFTRLCCMIIRCENVFFPKGLPSPEICVNPRSVLVNAVQTRCFDLRHLSRKAHAMRIMPKQDNVILRLLNSPCVTITHEDNFPLLNVSHLRWRRGKMT